MDFTTLDDQLPRTIVTLESLRNLEMATMGRFYVDESGNGKWESRHHRNASGGATLSAGLVVCYEPHNDAAPNAVMTAIKAVLPSILIDNTPGGLWGSLTDAGEYEPLGIHVYSYITGGYEGTKYLDTFDLLADNLARVADIAADGCTGVFLDEVTNYPDASDKAYLQAIYDECVAQGLKLIINTGLEDFDGWLMARCDYIMTDEGYAGRAATASETPYLDRVLLASLGVADAGDGAALTALAAAAGFSYHYPCDEYVVLPAWITDWRTDLGTTSAPASFVFDDTMCDITLTLDDREIYNDIRSEVEVTASQVIIDNPGSQGSALAALITGIAAGETKQMTITAKNTVTRWSPPYITEARFDIYGGTEAACLSMGGTFWPSPFIDGDPSGNHCLLQLGGQIQLTMGATTATTMAITLTNTSGYNIIQGNLVIAAPYDYVASPERSHEDTNTYTLKARSTDATSIGEHGRRTMDLRWPVGQSASQVTALADAYLVRHANAVPQLSIIVEGVTDTLVEQILTLKVSDLITVRNTRLGLDAGFFINTVSIYQSHNGLLTAEYQLEWARDEETLPLFTISSSTYNGSEINGPHTIAT